MNKNKDENIYLFVKKAFAVLVVGVICLFLVYKVEAWVGIDMSNYGYGARIIHALPVAIPFYIIGRIVSSLK